MSAFSAGGQVCLDSIASDNCQQFELLFRLYIAEKGSYHAVVITGKADVGKT